MHEEGHCDGRRSKLTSLLGRHQFVGGRRIPEARGRRYPEARARRIRRRRSANPGGARSVIPRRRAVGDSPGGACSTNSEAAVGDSRRRAVDETGGARTTKPEARGRRIRSTGRRIGSARTTNPKAPVREKMAAWWMSVSRRTSGDFGSGERRFDGDGRWEEWVSSAAEFPIPNTASSLGGCYLLRTQLRTIKNEHVSLQVGHPGDETVGGVGFVKGAIQVVRSPSDDADA